MHKAQRLLRAAELVKAFETFQPQAVRRPDGGWAVGYGHTRTAREGVRVSLEDAEALLLYDLMQVAEVVDRDVQAPLAEHQRDALTAFAFNIGWRAFSDSAVVRRLNAGDVPGAAEAIGRWDRTDVEGEPRLVDALVQRRAAETLRFLSPPDALLSSSTPLAAPSVRPEPELAPMRPAVGREEDIAAVEIAVLAGALSGAPAALERPSETAAADPPAEDEPAPPPVVPLVAAEPVGLATVVARPDAAPAADAPTPVPAQELAFSPVAPPFPSPRAADAPAVPSAPPPISPATGPLQKAPAVGRASARARRRAPRPGGRIIGVALSLVGAALFLTAVALIAAGPASAWKLLTGFAGVVILTPGAYLLLEPRAAISRG